MRLYEGGRMLDAIVKFLVTTAMGIVMFTDPGLPAPQAPNSFVVPAEWQHPDRAQYPKWGQVQSPDSAAPGESAAAPSSPASSATSPGTSGGATSPGTSGSSCPR